MPAYDIDKIKYGTDAPTFEKALDLYGKGKVTGFEEMAKGFSAVVLGTHPYHVSVSSRNYDRGGCDCYLGQNGILCKHIVALAICAVKRGLPLIEEDREIVRGPACSGKRGELDEEESSSVKEGIAGAMKHIKAYRGPSKIWFSYQNSLSEGCNRLSKIVSGLPVSGQTAKIVVDILLRLDKKLCGGVDDSDGTVGGFIEESVIMLKEFVDIDPGCRNALSALKGKETCFGWEEPLLRIIGYAKKTEMDVGGGVDNGVD